jgi:hypothetical protein
MKMGAFDTLLPTNKKTVVNIVKQEYLAYLFISNSIVKMQSQLKKDVANDYSKREIRMRTPKISTRL